MRNGPGGVIRRAQGGPLAVSRFLFGRDFFISYSRRDAASYAATLASRLSPRFSCYLDQLATPRGLKLPAPIRREVRRATVLVLVGSPGAIASSYVEDELGLFLETGRPLLLLDVDRSLDRAAWDRPPWSSLTGVYRERESKDAFDRAEPSAALLDYLRDSFTFTKQDRRLRLASTAAAVLLATVPISATLSILASRRAREAARRAAEARADEAAARASAEEQRKIGLSRRLAGESGAQMREHPDLGLLLAAAAHGSHPTAEARRSLFAALTFYPGMRRLLHDAPGGEAQGLATSADGRTFATGSHDAVTIWDAATLAPRSRITEAGENFRGFALSLDGGLLAVCRSQHVTLTDVATGRALATIEASTDAVTFVGSHLLAVGGGNSVEIWDVSAPARPVSKSRVSLGETVETVAGDPAGRFLVAATAKRVVVCSPVPCRVVRTLTGAHDIGLTTMAVPSASETPLVAATNWGGRLVVWDLETGERVASLSMVGGLGDRQLFQPDSSPGGDMFSVAFSPDGEQLATASLRGRFAAGSLEELSGWTAMQQAPADMRDAELALMGMTGQFGVRQLVYAPGVRGLAFAGAPPRLLALQMDHGLSVWDTSGVSPMEQLTAWPDDRSAHASPAFSAGGGHVLLSTFITEKRIYIWQIGSERPVALEPAWGDVRRRVAAIAADGEAVAALDEARPDAPWRTLVLWDGRGTLRSRTVVDGTVIPGLPAGAEVDEAVLGGAEPGRRLAASWANGSVAAWDAADLSMPRLLGARTFTGGADRIAFNPAGTHLAVAGRTGAVALWDLAAGTVQPLAGEAPGVVSLAFTADGRTLVAFSLSDRSGEETSRVVSWDVATRQPRAEWVMDGHDSFTLARAGHSIRGETLSISPDGTAFAVADDETVAIWDLESRSLLGAFRLPQSVNALAFAEGGDVLLAGHFDGVSRLEVGARRMIARACEVAGRSLTEAEAFRFLATAQTPDVCDPPPVSPAGSGGR